MPSTLESHSVRRGPRWRVPSRIPLAIRKALTPAQESDTALFLVAIICPPLAVSSIRGISSSDVTTNVLLTLCGWVPGVLGPLPLNLSV